MELFLLLFGGLISFLFLIILLYAFIGAIFASYMATEKHRGGVIWFVWGFLFGIIAMIALIGLPPGGHNARCPHCFQNVHPGSSACPYCTRELDPLPMCEVSGCGRYLTDRELEAIKEGDQVKCSFHPEMPY